VNLVVKKRQDYLNTPWGREAKWEDEQGRIQQEVNNETPREYVRTYDEVVKMLADGRSADDIRQALHRPPPFDPQHPSPSHSYEVAFGLAKVRLEAIEDGLAPAPARYRLRG
jgi:hypothetical protein